MGDASRPDVTAIVVNYKSAAMTVRALTEVELSLSAAGLRLEEVVVDNGSGGNEVEVVRRGRPNAIVIEETNRGFAAGNNAGIKVATGRYYMLVNPDAFAIGDAVAQLVAHADAHPQTGVVAPLLYDEDGPYHPNVYKRFPNYLTLFVDFCVPLLHLIRGTFFDPHNVWTRKLTRPRRIAHAVGAALLVRPAAAASAGPLDERFFLYLEETEWQRRIIETGWEIHVVPTAGFTHVVHASTGTHPLASDFYLDSIARYYPSERMTIVVTTVAGRISLFGLWLAVRLGLDRPQLKLAQHLETFREQRVLLRRRARERRAGQR